MKEPLLFFLITLALCLSNFHLTYSQHTNFHTENSIWYDGTIKLENGETIDGKLNYNFITEVLSHQLDGKSYPYIARNVLFFILRDNESEATRKFYSIPFQTRYMPEKKLMFFEIVYEKGSLAILSRHSYEYKEKDVGGYDPYTGVSYNSGKVYIEKVYEHLYLADDKGNILEYAQRKKDKNKIFEYNYISFFKPDYNDQGVYEDSKTERVANSKYKIVDKKAIGIISETYSYEVERFIKSNKLKLNTINELIRFMNFYDSLGN